MAPRFVAALALLALIALTSTADLGGDQPLSAPELALVVMALAAGAMLAIGVGTVAYGGGYAIFGGNRRRTKLVSALLLTGLLAAVVALAFVPIDFDDSPRRSTETAQPLGRGVAGDGGRAGDGDPAIVATLVAGGALLAALLLGVLLALHARRRRAPVPADEEEAVIQALDESLDDLRRERDVRRAIIACYARMERALERAGSARRPAEAPFEYLVRVLERITANGPAARALTDLFERAKFSDEPMGEREKEQAIGALELLRAEVSRPL
jgi:hypothetical protein